MVVVIAAQHCLRENIIIGAACTWSVRLTLSDTPLKLVFFLHIRQSRRFRSKPGA